MYAVNVDTIIILLVILIVVFLPAVSPRNTSLSYHYYPPE